MLLILDNHCRYAHVGELEVKRALNPARKAYVHVVRGGWMVNGERLAGESLLRLESGHELAVLVFDLAD